MVKWSKWDEWDFSDYPIYRTKSYLSHLSHIKSLHYQAKPTKIASSFGSNRRNIGIKAFNTGAIST